MGFRFLIYVSLSEQIFQFLAQLGSNWGQPVGPGGGHMVYSNMQPAPSWVPKSCPPPICHPFAFEVAKWPIWGGGKGKKWGVWGMYAGLDQQ